MAEWNSWAKSTTVKLLENQFSTDFWRWKWWNLYSYISFNNEWFIIVIVARNLQACIYIVCCGSQLDLRCWEEAQKGGVTHTPSESFSLKPAPVNRWVGDGHPHSGYPLATKLAGKSADYWWFPRVALYKIYGDLVRSMITGVFISRKSMDLPSELPRGLLGFVGIGDVPAVGFCHWYLWPVTLYHQRTLN